MLDLDITILFQMVNFFIALYVLNVLLIRPIRAILQERRDKMDELSGGAATFERDATERLTAYQAALAGARAEAGHNREAARGEALVSQQQYVKEAAHKAQTLLAEAQTAIAREADATMAALKKQVEGLAGQLAAKVMG